LSIESHQVIGGRRHSRLISWLGAWSRVAVDIVVEGCRHDRVAVYDVDEEKSPSDSSEDQHTQPLKDDQIKT